MSERDDARLLRLLGEALAPPPAEPSAEEVGALRAAVAAASVRAEPVPALRHRAPWRKRRAVPALAALALLASGGTAVAAGRGPVLPAPLRSMARAVGLPVDSPELAETKSHLRRLKAEMTSGGPTAAHRAMLRRQADALAADLTQLDRADWAAVGKDAANTLSAAEQQVADQPLVPAGTAPPDEGSPPTTGLPATTTPSAPATTGHPRPPGPPVPVATTSTSSPAPPTTLPPPTLPPPPTPTTAGPTPPPTPPPPAAVVPGGIGHLR